MVKKNMFSIFCTVLLACLIASPAVAQEPPPQEAPPRPAPNEGGTPIQISDEVFEKAINAYIDIMKINEELQSSMQTAKDQEARQKLQQAASGMMVKAVEKAGLTAESYNATLQQINADEATALHFRQKVQDRTQGQAQKGKKPQKK